MFWFRLNVAPKLVGEEWLCNFVPPPGISNECDPLLCARQLTTTTFFYRGFDVDSSWSKRSRTFPFFVYPPKRPMQHKTSWPQAIELSVRSCCCCCCCCGVPRYWRAPRVANYKLPNWELEVCTIASIAAVSELLRVRGTRLRLIGLGGHLADQALSNKSSWRVGRECFVSMGGRRRLWWLCCLCSFPHCNRLKYTHNNLGESPWAITRAMVFVTRTSRVSSWTL